VPTGLGIELERLGLGGEVLDARSPVIPKDGDSLDLLRAIYQDPKQPLGTRMRAASVAIKYERPALAVTVQTSGDTFANRMEQAWHRRVERRQLKLIEGTVDQSVEPQGEPSKLAPDQASTEPPVSAPGADRRLIAQPEAEDGEPIERINRRI
jgi:hypothetical protein